MVAISKIIYLGETKILLKSPYDTGIIGLLKSIPGSRYTSTYKGWHIPYDKLHWNLFLALGLPYRVEYSGTTDRAGSLSDNTGENIADMPQFSTEQAADTTIRSIRYWHPNLFIKGDFSEEEIRYIKSIPKVYYNFHYQNWVVPANLENLKTIHASLGLPDISLYEAWYRQIASVADPPCCTIYTSPEYPEKVLLQLSGHGVDVDYLKHIPSRVYDSAKKFWVIDNDSACIERISNHYLALKTKVVNRLISEGDLRRSRTLGEFKAWYLKKVSATHRQLISTYMDAMIREGYSRRTINSYCNKMQQFAQSIGPAHCDDICEDTVNAYLSDLAQKSVSDSLLNTAISAIKYYYSQVMYMPGFNIERIKRPRRELNLPKVISVEQVDRMLRSTENLKHVALLYALYGHGLRLSEILNLKLEDMLWDRNQIFVKNGKGNKDRYVNMSQEFKEVLKVYIHTYKPMYWLFEGQDQKNQYSETSVQQVVRNAARKAGIKQKVTPHTLRHCFATHLVDLGTQLPYVKELLGHADIKTTMIYTHITTSNISKVISPLDVLRKNTTTDLEKP